MAMLFVSYSRDDRQLSGSVLADLDALGHTVWVDEKLSGGQVWWDEILATIRRSDAFLFLLTPSSVQSEACLREAEYAHRLQRPIIPVELVATDPLLVPSVLGRHQIVRYLSGDKSDTIALTRALGHADMGRPLPDPLPPEPELPGTYYSELREQIASRDQLGIDQQLGLLQRLKARAEAGDAAEVIPLLATLRGREDVYAVVANGIDQLATSLAPPSTEAADAAPARPARIRRPQTRLERTAAATATVSLVLALGGLLSNKLYTESDSTEWFWGERTEDIPRWWWVLLVVGFAVAVAVAIATARTRVRRVGSVVAAVMALLLLWTWWGQISALLRFEYKTELGPVLQLLSWSVLLACLAATLGVVAAFTSDESRSGPPPAAARRADER